MKRRSLFSLLLLVVPVLPVQAEDKKADSKPEVEVKKDLVYGKGGDTEMQLDLAMPAKGDGPFPAMICIHGGGWRGGKRQDVTKVIQDLAGQGYVAVTVSYRLSQTAKFPAQIEDCKAAVRWLRANAKTYKVNPDRIAASGYSAGGHLASLLGVSNKDDGLEGQGGNAKESSAVQAVVNFFGPTDFTSADWEQKVADGALVPLIGAKLSEKPDLYKKASPITYVRKGAPPFLFFHGTEDKIVPITQARSMVEKFKGVGVEAKLTELKGQGHGWGGAKLDETMKEMVKFLDEKLKK